MGFHTQKSKCRDKQSHKLQLKLMSPQKNPVLEESTILTIARANKALKKTNCIPDRFMASCLHQVKGFEKSENPKIKKNDTRVSNLKKTERL